MTPLLEARAISKTFPMGDGELTVLHEINLKVRAGEMLAIVGAMVLAFVALWWLPMAWLDRRRIYLKI